MNSSRPLKGLSIAVIVISGLAILASLALLIITAIGGSMIAENPEFAAMFESELEASGDYSAFGSGVTSDEVIAMATGTLSLVSVFFGGAIIVSVVSLIAGILALRNANKPEKLSVAFGLGIAGAVVNFLLGNLITTVLLVIMVVYVSKVRKEAAYQVAYANQAQVALQNHQQYQQQYPSQTYQQPMTPQQPVQPPLQQNLQQPVQQQPYQPVQPVPQQSVQPVQQQPVQSISSQPVQQVQSANPNQPAPSQPSAQPTDAQTGSADGQSSNQQ